MVTLQYSLSFAAKIPGIPNSREDDHLVLLERNIFAVLDGVGGLGQADAQFSSRRMKEELIKVINLIPIEVEKEKFQSMLCAGIKRINKELKKEAARQGVALGTTLSLVRFFEEKNQLKMEYYLIGDSPISVYRLAKEQIETLCLIDNYFLRELVRREILSEKDAICLDDYEQGEKLNCRLMKHPILVLLSLGDFYKEQGGSNFVQYLIQHQKILNWKNKEALIKELWELGKRFQQDSIKAGMQLSYASSFASTYSNLDQFTAELNQQVQNILEVIYYFYNYGFYHSEIEQLMVMQLLLKDNQILQKLVLEDLIQFYFSKRNLLDNCIGGSELQIHSGWIELDLGDLVLLESDGTSDLLTIKEKKKIIKKALKNKVNFDLAADIMQAAKVKQFQINHGEIRSIRGKYEDDKTVIVILAFP
jgi:serine/threonine protein phosphatase PrpC